MSEKKPLSLFTKYKYEEALHHICFSSDRFDAVISFADKIPQR